MNIISRIVVIIREWFDPAYEVKKHNYHIRMEDWKVVDGYKLSRIIEKNEKSDQYLKK